MACFCSGVTAIMKVVYAKLPVIVVTLPSSSMCSGICPNSSSVSAFADDLTSFSLNSHLTRTGREDTEQSE